MRILIQVEQGKRQTYVYIPARKLMPCSSINGLGPASRGDHAPGETVDIASIWRQAKRAAILMSRLASEKK